MYAHNHVLHRDNLMRNIVITVAVVLSCAGLVQAQDLSASAAADELQPIATDLLQDARDLTNLINSRSRTLDCDLSSDLWDLVNAASTSLDAVQATQFDLDMYSLVSTAPDRMRIRVRLLQRLKVMMAELNLQAEAISRVLNNTPNLPAEAAILGTRMRDKSRFGSLRFGKGQSSLGLNDCV
jgi:hypothetical protein